MEICDIRKEIDSLKKESNDKYNYTKGLLDQFKSSVKNLDNKVFELNKGYKTLSSLAMVMDKLVDDNNRDTLESCKSLINEGLQIAFPGTDFTIDMTYNVTATNPIIKMSVIKDGKEESLENSQSGGVLEIISFLFRVLLITKKDKRKFIFVDEALNGVSELNEYSKNTSKLLKEVCNRKDFNLLLVTHKEGLSSCATNIYEAYKDKDSEEEIVVKLKKVEE